MIYSMYLHETVAKVLSVVLSIVMKDNSFSMNYLILVLKAQQKTLHTTLGNFTHEPTS